MHTSFTKRILSFFLAMVLLFSMVPAGLSAETDDNGIYIEQNTENSADQPSEEPEENSPTESEPSEPVQVTDVASCDELAQALVDGKSHIRITADMTIDRTFYITYDVTILTSEAHTLTRAADFAGDMFVVGESADGTACEAHVTLTLGDPASDAEDLLVIDGNKDNMTVDVLGTVVYICATGKAELHKNLCVQNCAKVGNERALTVTGGLSSNSKNAGGAVGIVVQGGELNVYGGTYRNNSVAKSDTSNGYGGAFYCHSTTNIYGGLFENNSADARAGAIYGYRALNIYRAEFIGNSSNLGGAIYMPSSTAAALTVGAKSELVESYVVFKNNTSTGAGGAVSYSGPVKVYNALFENNTAGTSGGAMYGNGGYSHLWVDGASFVGNSALNGGAIYLNSASTLASAEVDAYVDNATFTGNSATECGGVIYAKVNTHAYFVRTTFSGNNTSAAADANGGVAYAIGATFEANHCTIRDNNAYRGGAIVGASTTVTNDDDTTTTVPAAVILNDVTASGNYTISTSKGAGGFVYNSGSVVTIYDSTISSNQSYAGSAIYFTSGASGSIYGSTISDNSCSEANAGNAGAVYIYPGAATNILIHSCDFTGNTSSGLGGAILANGKGVVEIYNVTATGNHALKGGFMYETSAGTSVTISGLTVSGNTAEETGGGPIIWGNTANAKLYINKANYTDLDATGELDDAYWAAAIYNKLTVSEVDTAVPARPYYDQPECDTVYSAEVHTGQQLAGALASGHNVIKIMNDLVIDRTCYVTKDTLIYSDHAVTLTRATDFLGDIFVVGETADGTAIQEKVTLTLGDPNSTEENLLAIDGNSENMTGDVTGSVIFICCDHQADLYPNVTITNCTKVGNEKTLTEAYGVSYPANVGGAVGIVTAGASMNIYGGNYTDNHGGTGAAGGYGGAFYNFGTMKIYGGRFEGNSAYRAGVFYNYRKLYIYNAQITGNHAYSSGGAIYCPASTGSYLYVGLSNELVESNVTFSGNTSDSLGGAITCAATATLQNVTFSGNSADKGGALCASSASNVNADGAIFSANSATTLGGAMYVASAMVSADSCQFTGNTAPSGGAVYASGQSKEADTEDEVEFRADGAVFTENSADNGGAIYLADTARAYLTDAQFVKNSAAENGGAAYAIGANLEIDLATFQENTASLGAGIALTESATALMNRITATGNTATKGGFLYASASKAELFNSHLKSNAATKDGGAVYLFTDSQGGLYNTVFEENTAQASAGALFLYTNGAPVMVHSCTFTGNSATSGGAVYASGKAAAEFYNTTATGNTATKGGFLYETTTGTTITASGLTVSGNTATEGGFVVWGNSAGAVLNLNKTTYTDSDATGELDEAYWATAIYNKLTVNESDATVPYYADYRNEDPGALREAFDVASADELEAALAAGKSPIRITADFLLDRTFYITGDTIIFSSSRRTLTRAADFAGDIFVVGEHADGTLCSEAVTLTLGNPGSATKNLLTINGNQDNMTVAVSGTVIFVCGGANAELHENITVTDCHKTANEKTNTGAYGVSYPDTVGGAVAILAKSATMTIHGGIYANNSTNMSGSVSSYGGAFYNFGVLTVYGGTFEGNKALRGGAFYNYRTMHIYNATITGNSASLGGMVYIPSSTSAFLYLGGENEVVQSQVTISNNTSTDVGGAIYTGAFVSIQDTTFHKNSSQESGGAIYAASAAALTIADSAFTENKAAEIGGAIYLKASLVTLENTVFESNSAEHSGAICANGQSAKAENYEISAVNVTFTGNTAEENGGAIYLANNARANLLDSQLANNTATIGGAIYAKESSLESTNTTFTGNSAQSGGAIGLTGGSAVMHGSSGSGNTATENGGFAYADGAALKLYDCTVSGGSAANGGAIALRNASEGYFVRTVLENNAATANGGALAVGSNGSEAFLHSCTLTGNTAAENGGAAYAYDSGKIELYNATATGNTAHSGGVIALGGEKAEACVNGLTVSGNTATGEGSVIYSANDTASLTVSKENWTDSDLTGDKDDAYWASAIAGSAELTESTDKVPGFAESGHEDAGEYWQSIIVTTPQELEDALLAGESAIRIGADMVIDRTFVISADTVIFTTKAYTLTRAGDFTGDVFAVNTGVNLTLGNPISETRDLLVINGESISTAATVIRLADGAQAELYPNMTVKNCVTTENGAVAVVPGNAALTIHGGSYTANSAACGAVVESSGTLVISGGEFTDNTANANGGALYIAGGEVTLAGGNFQNNKATANGGAIAVIGKASVTVKEAEIAKNTAQNGGAIYADGATVLLNGTALYENKATANGGAIALVNGADGQLNNVLGGNNKASAGGFAYVSGASINLNGGTISGNKAADGAAIALVGATSAGIQSTAFMGNTASNNGTIWTDSVMAAENASFSNNNALNGGAIYATGVDVQLTGCAFAENTASYYGGAIALYKGASVDAFQLTATGNTASRMGGLVYASAATVSINGGELATNSASYHGGAVALTQRSVGSFDGVTFSGNTATVNGGAVYCSNSDATLNGCTFSENSANGFGGGAYITGSSAVQIKDLTTVKNAADKGGVAYLTGSVVVTVEGMTISGNTAATEGPVFYGTSGAALNVSPTGTKYEAAGAMTVTKITTPTEPETGKETVDSSWKVTNVSSAAQLQAALNAKAPYIRIASDFTIDRTFYITYEVTIFSTERHTLTRAKDFTGDIFVVGEAANGDSGLLSGHNSKLTLGNPRSKTENLLIIDGNRYNLTKDVVGSVIFVDQSAIVNLYDNVTIRNNLKLGNERILDDKYTSSHDPRVGGSVAAVISGVLNIYGGNYCNNACNNEDATLNPDSISTYGGAFYNRNTVYIYGGNFSENEGARGGAIYNYGIVKILGGVFTGNHATKYGGAYYASSSAGIHVLVGSEGSNGSHVLFEGNTAFYSGGAFYSAVLAAVNIYGNTTLRGNSALHGNGGAIYVTGQLMARNTRFEDNTASGRGGAIGAANGTTAQVTRYVELESCVFSGNTAKQGGALATLASSSNTNEGAKAFLTDCEFAGNHATSVGGVIHTDVRSSLTATNCRFHDNTSAGEAGVAYVIGLSRVTFKGCRFTGNSASGHGGAISVRSAYLTLQDVFVKDNTAGSNGGALYISYSSAYDMNSVVKIADSSFTGNISSNGGAFYVTKRTVTKEHEILTVTDTAFENNKAKDSGGAIRFTGGVQAYLTNVEFTDNSVTASDGQGGAISAGSCTLEIDGAAFTGNSAKEAGGAISMGGNGKVTLNDIDASRNTTNGNGGFLYSTEATLDLFSSNIYENTADNGGGIYLYYDAVSNIRNTKFTGNTAQSGGGLFLYTNGSNTLIHSCTLQDNAATGTGGGMYISGVSQAQLYNMTASGNSADKGGFLYETKAGTEVTLAGLTAAGNTAQSGGSLIWGNTFNAVLNINDALHIDKDHSGKLDDAYWATAIVNKLTVNHGSYGIPENVTYTPRKDSSTGTSKKNPYVSVQDVMDAGKYSSDASINSVYDKFPKLDNSSNFMSDGTTVFPNINGETVTVDTFVYQAKAPDGNIQVGLGLLIYQAMLYKQAYPDEEVYIDASSYRFSVQTAVNINRNSRYFGYVRDLKDRDVDEYGFVRIAYLLVSAAKMGIHVTVIGQRDAYPVSSSAMDFEEYFSYHLNDPVDRRYASGYVSDYMNYKFCDWTLTGKGGTDMMHTKMCTASAYLDMNGKPHYNAVWSSSSNFDGTRSDGANGNWKMQTATLVSDHADIYRVCHNYLQIVAANCEQEDVIEWHDMMYTANQEQIDLILAGKESQIPDDEQIVYLGGKNDPVFEMYFTPFAGGNSWNEKYNPYCKFVRKLYDSEDYIEFSWNAAEYHDFATGNQIEDLVSEAFHNNRNVNNKIYVNAESFDSSVYDDLVVGKDIGFKRFNERDFGKLHNKDIIMSYMENGQRYFVSLMNSLNGHSGAMYYQSNFLLVIKETSCDENSVYNTVANNSTLGGLGAHTYGDVQEYLPDGKDGYTYRQCKFCGDKQILGTAHHEGSWIIDKDATTSTNGIRHTECSVCGDVVQTEEFSYASELHIDLSQLEGLTFTADNKLPLGKLSKTPHTFEALIHVPKDMDERGGVIVSNYDGGSGAQISLEVYTKGRIRLYAKNGSSKVSCVFSTDIRSDAPVHVAVTISGTKAILYVNGSKAETKTLSMELPSSTANYVIGGDNRKGNAEYFKGTIYSVSLFSDARSAKEITRDQKLVVTNAGSLLYSRYFEGRAQFEPDSGKTFSKSSKNTIPTLTAPPKTIEAVIQLPKSHSGRGGVIVSNYASGNSEQLSLEIYDGGRVRLFVNSNGTKSDYVFSTDIRSDEAVHIAVTINGTKATLFVDGKAVETKTMKQSLPSATEDFMVGGDHRSGNKQYFKGKIYSVNLYRDVRTASEILQDAQVRSTSGNAMLYGAVYGETSQRDQLHLDGMDFSSSKLHQIGDVADNPNTIEALIKVPTSLTGSGGVIFGNRDGSTGRQISLEVYSGGRIRLYTRSGSKINDVIFSTDIRSSRPVHVAVTIDGTKATLYVNGEAVETKTMKYNLPKATNDFCIGGDHRKGNTQYFKGEIYSVAAFKDVRTAAEIRTDMIRITGTESKLMYHNVYTNYGMAQSTGKEFSAKDPIAIGTLAGNPNTIEAVIQLDKDFSGRGGVIVSNYDGGTGRQISLEVYTKGRIRLFTRSGDKKNSIVFSTDIRSDSPVHVAVTINGKKATLYVNGKAVETKTLTHNLPKAVKGFYIGGDRRDGNEQYFKGTIYSVALFDDVRASGEVKRDLRFVLGNASQLMYRTILCQPHNADTSVCGGHKAGTLTTDHRQTSKLNGIWHANCTECGQLMVYREIRKGTSGLATNFSHMAGLSFQTYKDPAHSVGALKSAPRTFEITLQLDPDHDDRGGVLVSNYDGGEQDQIALEIYTKGRPRLYYKVGGTGYTVQFATDVRSENPVHIAVVIKDTVARLYVDGKLVENQDLTVKVPKLTKNFTVGGDGRSKNSQYFKGRIYAVTLFNDVRTAKEVALDAIRVPSDAKGVVYTTIFP